MKKKTVVILVCALLIAAAVLPAAGIINISNTKPAENSFDFDAASEREISEPDDPEPEPTATKTGYLSIPAAAFTPRDNDMYVKNEGYQLTGEGFFIAPVYLPNGATVVNLTYYWRNEVSASARAHLSRNYMNGATDELANVWIDGSVQGYGVSWINTIDFAEIDNSRYSYFLELGIGSGMDVYGFKIEYTYKSGGSTEDTADIEESQVPNAAVR